VRRRVWVGRTQLDEYGEVISVHDTVSWLVGALPVGAPFDTLAVDYELDRYAGVLGLTTVRLVGVVVEIRAVARADPAAESEPLVTTRDAATSENAGFVVDLVLEKTSTDLEALRLRRDEHPGRSWSDRD
jgi:hypothetical protein